MLTGGYWFLITGRTLFATFFPHPPFYSAHLSHELERSVSRSKIYRCWQAAEVPLGLFILPPRQELTTSFRCSLFWSRRRHQLLHTSALPVDKAASIDPQSLAADTFIRRRWRPRHSPGPIKASALPTGVAGSKRSLADRSDHGGSLGALTQAPFLFVSSRANFVAAKWSTIKDISVCLHSRNDPLAWVRPWQEGSHRKNSRWPVFCVFLFFLPYLAIPGKNSQLFPEREQL